MTDHLPYEHRYKKQLIYELHRHLLHNSTTYPMSHCRQLAMKLADNWTSKQEYETLDFFIKTLEDEGDSWNIEYLMLGEYRFTYRNRCYDGNCIYTAMAEYFHEKFCGKKFVFRDRDIN